MNHRDHFIFAEYQIVKVDSFPSEKCVRISTDCRRGRYSKVGMQQSYLIGSRSSSKCRAVGKFLVVLFERAFLALQAMNSQG